jgi:hypothetical protein
MAIFKPVRLLPILPANCARVALPTGTSLQSKAAAQQDRETFVLTYYK